MRYVQPCYELFDKFSGVPPKSLCCQGEDTLFLSCHVGCQSNIINTIVKNDTIPILHV